MHTTSRLGLDTPDGTDAVSAGPTDFAQAFGVLDNAAMFLQGTLVSRPAAGTFGRWYLATDDTSSGSAIGTAWFDTGSAWTSAWNPPSRGAVSIAASESRTNTAYGTLTTPDQVTGIVLPTNGLIRVWYQAMWQESVAGAATAAIFIGSNQLQVQYASSNAPVVQSAVTGSGTPAINLPLVTTPFGLATIQASGGFTADVTTGQTIGVVGVIGKNLVAQFASSGALSIGGTNTMGSGGSCDTFAAAGTYTVGVQFKASSGSVTASNRKLWVQAISFS